MFGLMGVARLAGQPGGAFSPLSLFASGEQGVWYDPSDFSSMFQDSGGTTPVTAVGQPVGRINDKSGNGNHATQATAAARPVVSTRVNLWEQTEDFDNVYWTKTRSSISANSAVAPDGTITADKLVEDSTASDTHLVLRAFAANSPAAVYTLSVYAKAAERSAIWLTHANFTDIMFDLASGTCDAGGVIQNVGNGWFRCSVAATAPDTVSRGYVYRLGVPGQYYTGDGSSGVYLWRPQLELGSTATRYQRVTTASDYDSAGFPLYLSHDGIDDLLATTFPNLGSACTIARAVPMVGASILTGQTIGAGVRNDSTNHAGLVIIDRALTAGETAALTAYLNAKAGV